MFFIQRIDGAVLEQMLERITPSALTQQKLLWPVECRRCGTLFADEARALPHCPACSQIGDIPVLDGEVEQELPDMEGWWFAPLDGPELLIN